MLFVRPAVLQVHSTLHTNKSSSRFTHTPATSISVTHPSHLVFDSISIQIPRKTARKVATQRNTCFIRSLLAGLRTLSFLPLVAWLYRSYARRWKCREGWWFNSYALLVHEASFLHQAATCAFRHIEKLDGILLSCKIRMLIARCAYYLAVPLPRAMTKCVNLYLPYSSHKRAEHTRSRHRQPAMVYFCTPVYVFYTR